MIEYEQQMNIPNNQKPSGMANARPRVAIIAIAVWALIQVSRITAFSITQGVSAGVDSAAWLFPAFMDMFIGITAPFVAFAIWRKTGLAVWVTAIVWFVLSLSDHIDALTALFTAPLPQSMSAMGSSGFMIVLLINIVLDLAVLILLTRGKMKSHYLGSSR